MTPAEIKSARARLGLSSAALARALGVSDGRTVRRWEAGDNPIPPPCARLLVAMERWPEVRDWLMVKQQSPDHR